MKEDRSGNNSKMTFKEILFGKEINLGDSSLFHRLSLIAFLAWIGLGVDGLSSSCYGPAEAFAALGDHRYLAVFIGVMTVVTVFIIAASYSQIIELFPDGGGGYFVASKLLSPKTGMVSGCALIIDYVLTIALSISSGADALFSMLPPEWLSWKTMIAALGVLLITIVNLRGAKESVHFLIPIFLLFVLTHAFIIIYAPIVHAPEAPAVAGRVVQEVQAGYAELGGFGLLFLLLRAYSLGAGTYTGLEAVSNGMSMLREPKVQTGKRTMLYMAVSLSVTVLGLMTAYVLFDIRLEPGKTLNASLLDALTANWNWHMAKAFIILTLASEALILFAAAQTGFLGGPRIMANMALDRWLPTRFSMLSDRLVTQKGILCFSIAALILIFVTRGNVSALVVLYSINVFITFVLSQAGMIKHWLQSPKGTPRRLRRLAVTALGFSVSFSILCSVVIVKFDEGGWITILVTGALAAFALHVNGHYKAVGKLIRRLDISVNRVEQFGLPVKLNGGQRTEVPNLAPTAVLLVSGYNGLGISALLTLLHYHGKTFSRFVFLQVGVVDAGVFRRPEDLQALKDRLAADTTRYVDLMHKHGFEAEAIWAVGTDVVEETLKLAPAVCSRFPRAVFFGGQLVFENERLIDRILHNYQGFSLQRALYRQELPFEIIPIRPTGKYSSESGEWQKTEALDASGGPRA